MITGVSVKLGLAACLLCNSSYNLLKNYEVYDVTEGIGQASLLNLQNHSVKEVLILPFFYIREMQFLNSNPIVWPTQNILLPSHSPMPHSLHLGLPKRHHFPT